MSYKGAGGYPYWKPMWLCSRMVNTRAASTAAFTCPAANGAMVSGMIATANKRSKVQ